MAEVSGVTRQFIRAYTKSRTLHLARTRNWGKAVDTCTRPWRRTFLLCESPSLGSVSWHWGCPLAPFCLCLWKQVWLVVRHWVLSIFQLSLERGQMPEQWRHAKIIPLKKPGKADYTIAKAWRPISLLPTLGKLLESVMAERLSHAAETYGLLPANHFGAQKQRSVEQALMLLQEQICYAWRERSGCLASSHLS